jgi:superoxide reductase
MKKLEANIVDAVFEKHIPVVEVKDGIATVRVGSIDHPMIEEHYIKWIYLKCDDKVQRTSLKPGMKPEATFYVDDDKNIEVYAYCNLHGLWKTVI